MKSYAVCRRDFEALEAIIPLNDQVDLDSDRLPLMENPTKKYAATMYASGIDLWFGEHGLLPGSESIHKRHGSYLPQR